MMPQLFFMIWIRSNILCDLSGCSHPIFNLLKSLDSSFDQLSNCSTAKTREDTAKIMHPSPILYSIPPLHCYDSLGARTNFCQGPHETTYIGACCCFAVLLFSLYAALLLRTKFWFSLFG